MNKTKNIVINGIGVALFVALSMCLRVPVFENYYLCLGYFVMAIYCYCISPVSGTIVGVLGTILYCVLINGLRGMPGWAMGNIFIGAFLGFGFEFFKLLKGKVIRYIIMTSCVIIGTFLGILLVKSSVEMMLYSQPFFLRITNNIYAFIADIFVLLLSIPTCIAIEPSIKKIIKN